MQPALRARTLPLLSHRQKTIQALFWELLQSLWQYICSNKYFFWGVMNSSHSEENFEDVVVISADFYRKVRATQIRKAKRGKNRKLTKEDWQLIEQEVCQKRCFFPVQMQNSHQNSPAQEKMEISPEPEDNNLASSKANLQNEALFREPSPELLSHPHEK